MNCHDAIDIMDEAIEGRLDAARRAGFEEHMEECRPCGTYLQHLRLVREALHLQRLEEDARPRREELLEAFRMEFDKHD
jgi:anti-sigma factor RsiW